MASFFVCTQHTDKFKNLELWNSMAVRFKTFQVRRTKKSQLKEVLISLTNLETIQRSIEIAFICPKNPFKLMFGCFWTPLFPKLKFLGECFREMVFFSERSLIFCRLQKTKQRVVVRKQCQFLFRETRTSRWQVFWGNAIQKPCALFDLKNHRFYHGFLL